MIRRSITPFLFVIAATAMSAGAQEPPALPPLVQPGGAQGAPPVVTFRDALDRARRNDAQYQTAAADAQVAAEDRTQAKAALLPAVSHSTQYLGTQGNGITPNGRFVTNDGVAVYRDWLAAHQDVTSGLFLRTGVRRADAAEAVAAARQEIASRGLVVAVTRAFYGLLAAQRRYAAVQQAADQAGRFFQISQQQERLGQAAHADVVKAQISTLQQQQGLQDAALSMANARLDLAVLISPTLDENFTVVDDLDAPAALPPFAEAQARASQQNPDLRAATASLSVANFDVSLARAAYYPSLVIDAVYGIEANAFALHSVNDAFPEKGPLPNLGYFITANLTIPLWNWGATQSRVNQAQIRRQQATVELSQAQRLLVRNLYSSYNEASTARAAVDALRQASDLADDSVRLTTLRYQAGEATALEMVDAQNTLVQARGAYADALVRYRVAIATLQTVTGSF